MILDDLQLPQTPRVFVVAPHPDDEVFGCGGLLALLAGSGARIQVDIITDGGFGAYGKSVAARHSESTRAAELLGYPAPHFWDLPDHQLRLNESLVSALVKRFETFMPDLLLVPSVWEVHPDHSVLANASVEALRRSASQATLLFYEVGSPLPANLIVDITETHAKKQAAMHCFESQLAVQQFDRHIDGLNRFRTYTLSRGAVAAEAFHRPQRDMLDFSGVALSSIGLPSNYSPLGAKVSVLIRTTGRTELHEALASVAAQTYPNLEILIVDAAAKGLVDADLKAGTVPVRILESDCALGRSAAANRLLAACTGDYALFLDDDDWLLPGHVSALCSALEKTPEYIAAYADTICVEREGDTWREVRRFSGAVEEQRLAFENRLPIHAVLFRREAVGDLRFDQRFDLFEDWDWWLQLASHGKMTHVPAVGAVYRIHAAGGEGVRAEPQRSLMALRQIVEKWHATVATDVLVERLAYVRQVIAALTSELDRSTRLCEQLDASERENSRMRAHFEETLQLKEVLLKQGVDHINLLQLQLDSSRQNDQERDVAVAELRDSALALEEHRHELGRVRQELADTQQQLARIYRSNSWRITRPVRGSARILRRAVGLEAGGIGSIASGPLVGRLKQAVLARARCSGMVRWLYFRLPLSEAQRFKLRTWGRGAHVLAPSEHSLPVSIAKDVPAEQATSYLALPAAGSFGGDIPAAWPLVSVIIPCFNQGQFLVDSIASAYAAYNGPLEIIVVNDGSTAGLTLRCLRDIAQLYPDVQIINQENGGLSSARNAGIDASRGQFLQFLDADDLLVPGKLNIQVQHLLAGNLNISICNYLIADAALTEHAKTDETIAIHASFELADFLFKWERSLSIPIHCGLFSRQALQEIRFNTDLHAKEDWFFWCTLAKAGFTPKYIDFHGAVYRMHEGSMRRSFVRMARQWMQAVSILDRMVGDEFPDFHEQSLRWLNQYYRSNPIYQDEIKAMTSKS